MIERQNIRIKRVRLLPLLLLAVVFLLALFSGASLYWIAFWFFLCWALGSLGWVLYVAWNLDLGMEIRNPEAVRKSLIDLEIKLWNDSFLPLPVTELYLDQRQPFSRNYQIYDNSRAVVHKLSIDSDFILGTWGRTMQIECSRIGRYLVGPFSVKLYSLLGAVQVEKSFPQTREITVYPRLLPFSGNYAVVSDEAQNARRNMFLIPFDQLDHTESFDLRPFVPGDQSKLINWKVSAKYGDLYVRRTESKNQGLIVICLELAQGFYAGPPDQDLALEKVLSFSRHLLARGFQVGLFTYDGSRRYIPPGYGKKQLFMIRKLFTGLSTDGKETLPKHFSQARWAMQDADLIWMLPQLDRGYLKDLNRMRLHGQKLTLMMVGDDLHFQHGGLRASPHLLQLGFSENRVMLKKVKNS